MADTSLNYVPFRPDPIFAISLTPISMTPISIPTDPYSYREILRLRREILRSEANFRIEETCLPL